jgi:hypothetical protein
MRKAEAFGMFGLVLVMAAAGARAGSSGASSLQEITQEGLWRIVVPAAAGWVDAGFDVEEGDVFLIRAEGEITLQRGNPVARCGPDGLDLRTVQQPILDLNLGALIGKVAQLISVRIDEDTGEEIRDEILSLFPVGSGGRVVMPIRGRLFLGINESVVKDNGGEFAVVAIRISR